MKLGLTDKIFISAALLSVAAIGYSLVKKSTQKTNNIYLLGGLDTRKGDKDISVQSKLLKEGAGSDMEVKGFRYNNPNALLKEIESNSNCYVVLFSAGCKHALEVAEKIKQEGGDLSKMYVVEPYNSAATINSVKNAVNYGVPPKNIITGTYAQVGKGMVDGSTTTPKCSPSHWCSLTEVGKMILKTK
jgi:hypothetical protein